VAAYRRTHSLSRLAWSEGRRPLGAVLHSSSEPGELLQWLCHDDSTINIGICIIIIIECKKLWFRQELNVLNICSSKTAKLT